jgi:[acyl-carrier-protein] S-malonyltransferase
MKTAWVFPGQGSQAIGMGMDLRELTIAKTKLALAEEILGWSVVELCQGDEETLSRTLYTQPCLYVIESILVDLLQSRGEQPNFVAGHSLGEYTALYAAGVFSFEAGLCLIKRRAELMDCASDGMMAALLGCDRLQLETILAQTPNVVLANDNNAMQVVISGLPAAVETVMQQVKSKRAVKLNVSGAFHSPLMADSAAEFAQDLAAIDFNPARIPVLSNVDPYPTVDAIVLKQRLDCQMTGSVRWREISLQFSQQGVDCVTEIGPGKVLTGIIKRTCPELSLENISSLTDLPTGLVAASY